VQTLNINGTSFLSSSTVTYNGVAHAATFVNSTQLTISLSASDQATAGTYPVVVTNPSPGGGASNSVSFTVSTPPSISISPSSMFVAARGPQQFNATVTNEANTAVTWQVNGIAGGSSATGTITNTGLYTAPDSAANVTVTAVSQADTTLSASAQVSVLAPHPIAVRPTSSGIAEFYDVATGNSLTPRGNNYIRLAWQQPPFPGSPQSYYHSTFNVGLYDSARAETALSTMQANGYNIVRVFLNGCCVNSIGNPNGAGLSSAYIANMVDFLGRAANHHVYVLITSDWLPSQGGYNTGPCNGFTLVNVNNLCPGGVAATVQFFHDLVQALIAQGAHLDAIFSYELRNEYYYSSDQDPLDWTSGNVTAADGRTYDMSSNSSRQQMMDNGLIYFTDQVQAAIVALDPTALVDVGFFSPQTPNPTRIGDSRVIEVYPMIANSTADFADLHPYPIISDLTLPQLVQNYGFVGYQQQKPVLMGEFGAFESDYPLISDAASVLQSWQTQSCAYSFKGWLLWTWDTFESEQVTPPYTWAALAGDGSINVALAPATRPDPCQ
jgi:hypothetical protein